MLVSVFDWQLRLSASCSANKAVMTPPLARLILAVLTAAICIIPFSSTAAPGRDEWEGLAKKGDLKSMISLGVMYHTGDGVETNYQKAMDWYLQAYEKKDGDAFNNIGVLFRDGLGVPKNEKVAYILFLTVHMEGLGTEATQYRAGRNLSRLSGALKQEEIHEVLSYTWQYVDQIVKSRGASTKIGNDVLPGKTRLRIRDFGWWLPEERKRMEFKSPPPWDMAAPVPSANEEKTSAKSTNAPVTKPK
jgi:hypothetical protein